MKNILLICMAATFFCAGCSKDTSSFSTLPVTQNFSQGITKVNNKVDVLWVVDNSSSMTSLQNNLVSNFNSFISTFQNKGYDFRIAVTSTDAYLAGASYSNDSSLSRFRDGSPTQQTGVYVLDSSSPNLIATFTTNASLGQTGSGDERAFQSIQATLSNPTNNDFLRTDSFLAVIILSDEDDFSDPSRPEYSWNSGGVADHDYTNPGLITVDSHIQFMDQLTSSTSAHRRYNVSAITVKDTTCLASHQAQSPSSIIGQRYMDLANKTDGVLGSICDANYGTSLQLIQQKVIELSTQFSLDRVPVVSSIQVTVNNQPITMDSTNGWTYSSTTNSITFHGTAIPAQGATITVNFSPASITM